MSQSEQTTQSTPRELLGDGKLAGAWTLDAAKSEIGLKTKSMWGMVSVKGVFREVTGSATVSATGDVTGTITVAAGSIDTKIKKRDDHLRSADFFEADKYPSITFAATEVTPSGAGVTVTGALTVKDQTRPVSFTARVSGSDGAQVELDGELQVNRTDFGLSLNQLGMMSVHNTLTVHAVFAKE